MNIVQMGFTVGSCSACWKTFAVFALIPVFLSVCFWLCSSEGVGGSWFPWPCAIDTPLSILTIPQVFVGLS